MIEILDTTLRDGAQGENISFSVRDKLSIARELDRFGISFIEAGNPMSNPKDVEFFQKSASLGLKNAKLAAFGGTRRKTSAAKDDEGLGALLECGAEIISLYGKASVLHATEILQVTPQQNLEMIYDSIEYLVSRGKTVFFDAEHFFDGCKTDKIYAMKTLETAYRAGAKLLCLCDTNGGSLPDEIYGMTAAAAAAFPDAKLGVHCHNDCGCAVASTIAAVRAGASHVQGTFIGIGERCGNADLSVLIPNIKLKMGLECIKGSLSELKSTVSVIAEIANCGLSENRPYTGASAFAHKGGAHIDGVQKNTAAFEHVDPETVGNRRRILASEVSGRSAILAKIERIAPELTKESDETAQILQKIKNLEHEGFTFEAADASFDILVMKILGRYEPHFGISMYKTTGEFPAPDGESGASAMLMVEAGGSKEITAAVGNGPVNALDKALRKALGVFYPQISDMRLVDYKVRVLSAGDATAAKVRVLIESASGADTWTTVGVSADIIEASLQALVDSIEYFLYKSR